LWELARQGSAEAAAALGALLNDRKQPLALRCEAARGLGGVNQPGVMQALVQALSDPEVEVRKAAAWGLNHTEATGNVGPALLSLLQSEQDSDVRRRLYRSLTKQENLDAATALRLVQRETDLSVRLAGLDLLAKTLRDNPPPAVQNFFDQTAVPELKQIALSSADLDDQNAAFIVLERAHTPAAQAALQEITRLSALRETPTGEQQ
jgi:HEAT repeat protein